MEQALALPENMENKELNARLREIAEERESILHQHGGGFLVNDEIFVLVHEVAVHGLACDRLPTHAF